MSTTPESSVTSNGIRSVVFHAAAFVAAIFIFGGANTAFAATITSTATGGDWATASTWVGGVAPANGDDVIIATTGGNSVTISANKTVAAVTVYAGGILSFTGANTLTENGSLLMNGTINGTTGILKTNANGLAMSGSGTINSTILISRTASVVAGANLTTTGIITLANTLTIDAGAILNAFEIDSNGKTVANNGTVNLSGDYLRTGKTAVWTQGANAVVNIRGSFTPSANVTLNATASGNVVNYNGASPSVDATTYANLTLSGSGAAVIASGTSVSGTMSIAPTGSATASIGAGLNIAVGSLTLGGHGRINGTWGSTSSTATYKNNTYFAATTGRLTVSTDTRVGQTITFGALGDKSSSDADFGVSATASSGLTVAFSSLTTGVCTVSTVMVHLVAAGTCTIRASQAGDTSYTAAPNMDQSFTVRQSATKFVILPPTSGTVDAPVTVTVQAQKPDGSIDTYYRRDVTLHTSGSAFGGGLIDIVDGVGTTAISDTVPETVTLSLVDSEVTGLDVSSTQSFAFASGITTKFVISHSAPIAAGQRETYTITREDQYDNPRTAGTSTVYLYSSSTSVNKKFYDAATGGNAITSITIPDGQSSVDVWYYDELAGTWTITASDNATAPDGNTGINDAIDALHVMAGSVARFIIDHPGEMTVGTRLGYTLSREDQFANAVTAGATTVYLYSNSTGTSTALFYSVASGGTPITSIAIPDGQSSVSAWYYDPNVGTWTITASDNATAPDSSGITDAASTVVVHPVPIVATRFVIELPVNGTVDASIPITIQAQDVNGNIDSTYQNDVTLNAGGSATGGGLINIVNGVATIALSDTVAETVNLSLTDSQGTALDTSSTRSVTFAPGAVAQFTIDNPGDVAAGMRIGYTVTRKDQFGNLVTAGATDVYLYGSSDGLYKKFYDAASGGSSINSLVISDGQSSGNFWYYDEKAGNWFITASDNATAPDSSGISDASDAITVQPSAVARFLLSDSGNMTAGTRLGYTVVREDQFGNLVTVGVTLAYLYTTSTGGTSVFYDSASGGIPITIATLNDGQSSSNFWYYDASPGDWAITVSDSSIAPNGAIGIVDDSDPVTVSSVPIVATRFVISPAATVQVGTPATVTVRAEDAGGNLDTTYQQDVTLDTTGAATGAGLVNVVDGVGAATLSDTVAETVTLSLSDTESTGLDITSTRSLTFSATPVAPPSGGGAGGGIIGLPAPVVTGVRISGRAFPGAQVTVLALSPKGATITGKATATANGSFSVLLTGVGVGAGSYGITATDALNRTTQTKILTANYRSVRALLTLDASVLSPTLGLVHPVVRQGDVVGFVGDAIPGYTVRVQIDGVPEDRTATVATDGSYKILFPTATLALGSHAVRVQQVSPAGVRSDYAPQKVFVVTTLFTPQTDFNQDGVVNIQDWSVFLARWSSPVASVRLLDDLNGDGKVDVTDLSIFVRTLKK